MALLYSSAILRILFFAVAVEAYSVITTSCSKPNATANFVTSPDSRGTLDILWSSLFTLIACTWTVQHPNVPKQRSKSKSSFRWQLGYLRHSALRTLTTIFAPEILVSTAWHDLEAARKTQKKLESFAKEDGVEWTLAHSYFANMGGFIIRDFPSRAKTHNPYHLDGDELFQLRDKNILRTLPDISEDELLDKSKDDGLVKAIAVCQILWTTMQIGVRLAGGLGVSQLEVAVLAFAVCALIIYAIYWPKPKCTNTAISINIRDDPTFSYLDDFKGLNMEERTRIVASYMPSSYLKGRLKKPPGSPLGFDQGSCEEIVCVALFVSAISTSLFGAVHLLAWNFVFPTAIDQWLWRVASIYSVLFGAFLMIQGFIPSLIYRAWISDAVEPFVWKCLTIAACVYAVARLVVMVIFRTLFFLPPDVFVSTWASHLPHFG